jgi:Carbohydrate-binding module 48 (Isoamylase N-terminal domain)
LAENSSLAAVSRGALVALLFFAPTINAQSIQSTLDVGGVALRYADTLNASAATVTPRVVANWGNGIAEASGTYSQFGSGGWSTQGVLSGSLFTPTARGLLAELAALAGGSSHNDGTRTGVVLANGRLHFMRARGELFLGAGGGRTWVGGGARSVLLGEAGASTMLREVAATFTLSPTAVGDSIKYTDGQLSLSLTRDELDLGAVLGTRLGDQLTSLGGTARSWGSLSAIVWMRPRLGLAASGGTYPIDPTQGFPGGRFVSVSVRFAPGRSRQSSTVTPSQIGSLPDEVAAPVSGFAAVRDSLGGVSLRVHAPRAKLVELSGDFTNWVPVPMSPTSGGWWAVTLPITPGKYQMNLRLDGGKWLVPPGLLSMSDEFGGTVGLLIVE